MTRLRYVGPDEACETFGRTFHRSKWNGNHGLDAETVATLAANPQFEASEDESPDFASSRAAQSEASRRPGTQEPPAAPLAAAAPGH